MGLHHWQRVDAALVAAAHDMDTITRGMRARTDPVHDFLEPRAVEWQVLSVRGMHVWIRGVWWACATAHVPG